MIIVRLGIAAAVLAAGMTSGSAFATTVGELLADGWQVVDTEVVSKDVVVRAMGNDGWVDDVMITLQKGTDLAFCHVSLLATANDPNVLAYNCLTPAAAPSVPSN